MSKDSALIEASGSLDELNALIGLVRTCTLPDGGDRVLEKTQNDLFAIGTQISTPEGSGTGIPGIGDEEIGELEREIDALEGRLSPLRQFILPGGSREAAELHLARTVARRAERRCVTLSRSTKIDPRILRYLNRLSDLFSCWPASPINPGMCRSCIHLLQSRDQSSGRLVLNKAWTLSEVSRQGSARIAPAATSMT